VEALWVNGFLWLIPNTFLELHGELPDASARPKIVVCNHATEVDWIYLWMVARVTNYGSVDRTGSVKIMLKDDVRIIPIMGWGCSLFDFIFLKRNWDVDHKRIENSLKQFASDGEPVWIFLFPEGSTVNTRSLEKSRAWGAKSSPARPDTSLTLLPRSRGFDHVCETLLKYSKHEPEVFDLTMTFEGYSGEVPSWEMGYKRSVDVLIPNFYKILFGTASRHCHIESTKFVYKQLKQQYPHGLESWLDERWVRKEKLLRGFAANQTFDEEECGKPFLIPISGSIWGSMMAVAFYTCMWFGMLFTYAKYSTDGRAFFHF